MSNQQPFGEEPREKQPIVLVLATDQGYFAGLWITLLSLMLHTSTPRFLKIYVFDGGVSASSKESLTTALRKLNENFSIEWLVPDIGMFKKFLSMEGNYMSYSRLLIPDNIPEEKVIWLDVDLLVLKDIELLWEEPLEGAPLAAVPEAPQAYFQDDVSNLAQHGIAEYSPYFNAGVLVMSRSGLQAISFAERSLQYLQDELGNYKFWDQSAINVVCHKVIKPLDRSFNYLNTISKSFTEELLIARGGGYIYHYLQRPKPWQRYGNKLHTIMLYKLAELSGLELVELDKPGNKFEKFKYEFPFLAQTASQVLGIAKRRSKADKTIVANQFNAIKKYANEMMASKDEIVTLLKRLEEKYFEKTSKQ